MWSSKIHERQKFLVMKIVHKGISLKRNLISKGVHIEDTMCLHGCYQEEYDVHLFFHCHYAKALWFTSPWGIRWKDQPNQDIKELFLHIWSEQPGTRGFHSL